MGGNNTTRRVVIENEEGASVVRISEAAAKQLRSTSEISQPAFSAENTPDVGPQTPYNVPSGTVSGRPDNKAKELEEYYISKLKLLEERNAWLYEATKHQFSTAVEEVEQKFLKHSGSPVCQDLQEKVVKCYETYPHQTLQCSPIVASFVSCVELARKNIVLAKTV